MTTGFEIVAAELKNVEAVAPLFDDYRVWYGKERDPTGSRNFLTQRIRNEESQVFLALNAGVPAGFTQLYPLFSSVSMQPVWLLNDLFVAEAFRKQGVGTLLLQTAADFARELGAIRLELATGVENFAAQSVYENHGWQKDSEFVHFSLPLD